MTSIERIMEYSNLKGEDLKKSKIKETKSNWPSEGKIEFDDVSFSYDENLPNVLQNITFTINPKEKIGIVGITGDGKSTFFQALYRMSEPKGKILIDNVNIKDISLYDLRNAISIIPVCVNQNHTLF